MDHSLLMKSTCENHLDGQLLVAMPTMSDQRFARTVIYLCTHSHEGAMGLIINKPTSYLSFPKLLLQLEIIQPEEVIRLPKRADRIRVLHGGPVEEERGFVLHSSDYQLGGATLEIDANFSLTATLDILRAIAQGLGPQNAMLALGSAQWAPGQLDREMQMNGWLTCPADPALVFETPYSECYQQALQRIGINIALLSEQAGHA